MIRFSHMARLSLSLTTLATLAVCPAFAAETSGTLTLNGRVDSAACTVTSTAVDLGSYSADYFTAKGTKGKDAEVRFNVICTTSDLGHLHFFGEQDTTDPTLFKNTSSDNGIAIELVDPHSSKGERRRGKSSSVHLRAKSRHQSCKRA